MVFSFFKKPIDKKMPERPAARPRAPEPAEPAVSSAAQTNPAGDDAGLEAPLPDLEFSRSNWKKPVQPQAAGGAASSDELDAPSLDDKPAAEEFSIDDFDDRDFSESSVMAIDVDHDIDPLQACVEQVVVMFANGQDAAARSLLETFVRSYPGPEGKRFWLLLFDLLQVTGDRAAFDKLCVEYAHSCETSPPNWKQYENGSAKSTIGADGQHRIYLQGVLTTESALPLTELARLVAEKASVVVDGSKLIGCDDEIADQLAALLGRARRQRLPVTVIGMEGFAQRLSERLAAGDPSHEPSWRLLLELLQRHGTQAEFEERAVDYAVTFELSPPSWESIPVPKMTAAVAPATADDAFHLSGELKNHRFEELSSVFEEDHPVLDFSGVRRLDFFSAGQLVNRVAPFKARGKEITIRSPNLLVAELMAVVGLNKLAHIVVPKS